MGVTVQYIVVFALLAVAAAAAVRHFVKVTKSKGGCPNCPDRDCCCHRRDDGSKKCGQ